MEPLRNAPNMLDMFAAPAFCVENGAVSYVNQPAQQRLVCQGTDIFELISTGKEEYTSVKNGCVYLSVTVSGHTYSATAVRLEDKDVFILEDQDASAPLQVLALAARDLRMPLGSIYTEFDRFLSAIAGTKDPAALDLAASINRRINQLSRIVGNMASAGDYKSRPSMEVRDITAIFEEVFQHAVPLAEEAGKTLRFQGLSERVFCHLNAEMVERAAYNLISNALKFTPQGGWIEAKLTKTNSSVCLTVTDSGSGIPASILSNVFTRYLRPPAVEDGNYGIGLGMLLVRSAAAAHGGTVLVEQPKIGGPRITVSFSLAEPSEPVLRSPMTVDYAGGRSHSLIELSDALPAKVYKPD